MQELTPQSVRQFSEAEVTAKSALSVCHLWNWLGGALGFSLELLGRGSIAGQCQTLLMQAYSHLELQRDLCFVVTCPGLGGAWERMCCELRLAVTCASLVAA